jgi:hypothetical protein
MKQTKKLLGKLPSVFENKFPSPGIVLTKGGPKVGVYVASELGFSYAGRYFLENYVHPKLEELGAFIFDPFRLCGEYLTPKMFDKTRSAKSLEKDWKKFGEVVIPTVDYELLIPKSGLMFAICEGSSVDEGMAAEMAFMATNFGPVIAVRSDFRLGESLAAGTNFAVSHFASRRYFGGSYHENSKKDLAYESAFKAMKEIIDKKLKEWGKSK